MIQTSPDDTDQLSAGVDCPQLRPLVVTSVPFLCAVFHLCSIIGSQGQMLQMTTSCHGASRNKVVQGKRVERPESTPWTLHCLIDRFGQRVQTIGFVASSPHVLDVVLRLELLKALGASIVDVLGIGDELGRRGRSVGGVRVLPLPNKSW